MAIMDGLYFKYKVEDRRARSTIPDKHWDSDDRAYLTCEYFVLDIAHDPEAREALMLYVDLIAERKPKLSEELYDRVEIYNQRGENAQRTRE